MNNCVFAIPGLMPPAAAKKASVIITPEDGSLLLCVHAGLVSDIVTWTLVLGGKRHGVVKDPDYQYTKWNDTPEQTPEESVVIPDLHEDWQQFLKSSDSLPEDCIIPVKVCNGFPRPITELDPDQEVHYWYLQMPIRSLPIGDSKVEICVNGKMRTYILQRPAFAIHKHMDNLSSTYINAGK